MFSLSKILALAAIIVAVLAAYRFIGRLQARQGEAPRRAAKKPRVEDMTRCPRCGSYVAIGADHDCPVA
ncbi:MAG: hypothetical protein VXX53_08820 [Pseudomonadota bacterium]|nr:hypothetical protein [Pseudomonadota bacterium]